LKDVTLKVTTTRPVRRGLSLTLTVLVVPTAILPTGVLKPAPRPLTLSLTPVARVLPELVIATL
jgi:hypothetical protein